MEKEKIPTNLEEAVQILKDGLTVEQYDILIDLSYYEFIGRVHYDGGMAMRNRWKLWSAMDNENETSPLAQWFTDRGIIHADDMSGIIYMAFWAEVTCNEFDLEKRINYYRNFWKAQGINPDTMEKKENKNYNGFIN